MTDRPSQRGRWAAAGLSAAFHAAILFALLAVRAAPPVEPEPPVITVSLVQAPAARPAKRPASPVKASAPTTVARSALVKARTPHVRSTPDTLDAGTRVADAGSAEGSGDLLSGAALGSAVGADALPGGACDMARRVQSALRRDSLVRAAVAARSALGGSGAILVWNGGWIASRGEDGRGLSAVREAIVWEVAFAPAACRQGRVRGPVLFTVSEASGLGRIAIGSGDWSWGDLVSSR